MEDRQMETSKTEKEWFRRINGQHPMTTDDKEAKTTDASRKLSAQEGTKKARTNGLFVSKRNA